VYVIAGPNGAGKTTFASEYLPDLVQCREFLNADLIAAGLSPFAPETQDMLAARLLLTRARELVQKGRSFAFETTLSGRGYARQLQQMKDSGYRVALFFLWLSSVDLAKTRVRTRVLQGGHNIPEHVIVRRYDAGLRNLFELYRPLADVFQFYDASALPPIIEVFEKDGATLVNGGERFAGLAREKRM